MSVKIIQKQTKKKNKKEVLRIEKKIKLLIGNKKNKKKEKAYRTNNNIIADISNISQLQK